MAPQKANAPQGPGLVLTKDGTPPSPKKTPPPTEPLPMAKHHIHSKVIFQVLAVIAAVNAAIVIHFVPPSFFMTLAYTALGLPVGLALSFLFFQRTRQKGNISRALQVEPGVKGIKYLVSALPTWTNMGHSEKVEWLNAILLEVWPFYDAAACAMIKEIVEPLMDQVKPPLVIKRIGFKKLQFGDAPIRIEAVRMDRTRPKTEIFLEMDFRWAGDANIVLSIDPAVGGSVTRMCPRISNLRCTGTLGVVIKPLVDEVPGFGAVLITLMKPPKITYRVDLGKALGGNITGGAVGSFVDSLIPTILEGFLIWPQRIVVPLFDETITGPLDELMLRHRGILKITVVEAKDIPRMDSMGKSDPYLQFFTDATRKLRTKTKKNTLEPVWEEEFYLMVQEPQSQELRWEMFDVDTINLKAALNLNLLKGAKDLVGSSESMCKGELLLADICTNHVGDVVDTWYHCGPDDWSNDDGPGKGRGQVHLKLQYLPLMQANPMAGQWGALFVRAKKGTAFPAMEGEGETATVTPYIIGKVDKNKQTGTARFGTLDPDWTGEVLEFYDVSNSERVVLTFMHRKTLGDEEIGTVTIDIPDVRTAIYRGQHGALQREYNLEADSGRIWIETQFVAYF